MLHLDETSLAFPPSGAATGSQTATTGALPGITLSDNLDLTPLLEHDSDPAAAGISPFGQHASVRFDAWIPPPPPHEKNDVAIETLCVPSSLTFIAGPGSLSVPIPSPAHGGWAAGKWHSIEVPINNRAGDGASLDNGDKATWNALTRLELNYKCGGGDTTKTSSSASSSSSSSSSSNSIKIQLVRICKTLPIPSFCTVASTSVYKTECHECNCQTCHKEDCKCLTTYLGTCPFDTCADCPCVPFCQCCYESKCDYPCNCETCCESRSFTSCATAITYGVVSLLPAGGMEGGGAHVIVKSTSSFLATPEMACRFGEEGGEGGREGGVVVPATLLSSTTMACVAPPFDATAMMVSNSSSRSSSSSSGSSSSRGGEKSVVVEVSLDGQQWTSSGRTFHYCPSSSSSSPSLGGGEGEEEEQDKKGKEECLAAHDSCLPGWTGKGCNLKCPGSANNPCNGGGFCVAVATNEEGKEEEEASCVCKSGYEGAACEIIISSSIDSSSSSSSKITSKAVASSSSSSEPSSSSSSTASSAMRQGMLLGVGACLLLLTLAGLAVYVKRTEVGEFVFWTLAATRFERLQQGQGESGGVGEVEEGRGGGRRSVELTAALRQEDDEEGGEVTML